MDRLIVKNFGPLKNIDIELNKINLFIGENGSGKSVLGKLITVLFDLTVLSEESFLKKLQDFKINFLQKDTKIKLLMKNNLSFEFSNSKMSMNSKRKRMCLLNNYLIKLANEINTINNELLKEIEEKTKNEQSEISPQFLKPLISSMLEIYKEEKNKNIIYKKELKFFLSAYIPSERNFVSIISQSLSSFIVADIPLPKYFLQFSSDFENGANRLKELKVLNVHYKYGDGLDRHKVYFDDKNYLPLNESSSGIQAVIPLLITYQYFNQKYQTIVIEEPEQNLFPKAQKEVVDFLIENLQEKNRLFLMTHSPYILTALNNLILANDVKEEKGEDAIKGIVKTSQCIPFEDINAYYIKDGKAVNIMDKENRLIGVNVIDEISDEVNETFDILLSKLD